MQNGTMDMGTTDQAFLDQCRPKLEQLESIRLDKLRAYNFRKRIAIPLGVILTPIFGWIDWLLLMWQRGSDDSFAGISIAVIGGIWWWATAPKRQYARAYKRDILPDIAGLFGDFRYDPKGKIPMDQMKPSKIVPGHTSYDSEDFFEGRYKEVQINFSEIKLKKKSGKSTVTVFKGLAVLLSQGTKKFHGHTILTKDQGTIGGWFKKQSTKLERADLVDPEFERQFDVFTNDQVEARYLIDPAIIERIKALSAEYNGERFMAAFYDDHVLILIASEENHFEPARIETPATDEASLVSMKHEIGQILSIVDQLELYDPRRVREAAA